jgi:ribonuclease P protein component
MKNGFRVRPTDWLLINYARNSSGQMRCGWTLPRQVGNAVVRNRFKRWSRVYFRALLVNEQTLPIDVNLVFRKAEDDFFRKLNYDKFSEVLDRGWQQIGVNLERLERQYQKRPR